MNTFSYGSKIDFFRDGQTLIKTEKEVVEKSALLNRIPYCKSLRKVYWVKWPKCPRQDILIIYIYIYNFKNLIIL